MIKDIKYSDLDQQIEEIIPQDLKNLNYKPQIRNNVNFKRLVNNIETNVQIQLFKIASTNALIIKKKDQLLEN